MISQQNIKFLPKLHVSLFIVIFVSFIFFTATLHAQASKFTVVLDAGHGGKDPGTVGLKTFKKSYESDIALKVVTKLGQFLHKETDIKTVFTRDKNIFIPLHKRGKIANKANADLFISVHCNAASTNAYGTATYVLGMAKTAKNLELSKRENDVILLEDDRAKNYKDPNSPEFLIGLTLMQENYLDRSIEFASIVQNKFRTVAKRKNRGVHQGNLAVLYDSYMPSVLIEIGFLTNKIEEKYLHTSLGQSKIAESIYKAIKTYKKRLEKNSVQIVHTTQSTNTSVAVAPTAVHSTQSSSSSSSKYYKIQIATSKKKIEAKSYNFRGLKGIERVKVGSIYKYFFGISNNLKDARKLRLQAVKKGYKDAFVKKFKFSKTDGNVYKLTYVNTVKNKKAKTLKSTTTKTTNGSRIFKGVDFKVQLSSSPTKVALKSYNFKGLKNVERVKIGHIYKYYYGKTNDYNLIKEMQKKAKKKGYKDCLVVAIENGKRVSIRTILRR